MNITQTLVTYRSEIERRTYAGPWRDCEDIEFSNPFDLVTSVAKVFASGECGARQNHFCPSGHSDLSCLSNTTPLHVSCEIATKSNHGGIA